MVGTHLYIYICPVPSQAGQARVQRGRSKRSRVCRTGPVQLRASPGATAHTGTVTTATTYKLHGMYDAPRYHKASCITNVHLVSLNQLANSACNMSMSKKSARTMDSTIKLSKRKVGAYTGVAHLLGNIRHIHTDGHGSDL